MKKFSVPCFFGGQKAPFTIYIGAPEPTHHPLHFQSEWLSKERGGQIPQEIMQSIQRLKELAEKNNVSFEELCVYALGAAAQSEQEQQSYEAPPASEPQDESSGETDLDETGSEEYAQENIEASSEDLLNVAEENILEPAHFEAEQPVAQPEQSPELEESSSSSAPQATPTETHAQPKKKKDDGDFNPFNI